MPRRPVCPRVLRVLLLALALVAVLFGAAPRAARAAGAGDAPPRAREHGPAAPDDQLPSHVLQLRAHEPERVQLSFHSGLSQPLLAHGFNAAVDVRYRRLVLTYSHGQGLDVTSTITGAEKSAGMTLRMPWTTGGGIGVLLVDELWVLADVKVHRFEAATSVDRGAYTTVTIGGEIGWRFFVWKGFHVALVARYWPNVYATSGAGTTLHDAAGRSFVHAPAEQGLSGFLGNVLVGWAFGL